MIHKAQAGDRVVRTSGFGGFFDLTITKRASKTIQTQLTKDIDTEWCKYQPPFDSRGNPKSYRLYEEDKVKHFTEINNEIKRLQSELGKIYDSLPQIE